MKGQENEPGTNIYQLETAISSGDVKTAQTIVAHLAKQKASVKIELIHKEPIDIEYRSVLISVLSFLLVSSCIQSRVWSRCLLPGHVGQVSSIIAP